MKRKMKKCYECCSAVADKNGKLLGSCIYIAFPEKIVEKESEYLPCQLPTPTRGGAWT